MSRRLLYAVLLAGAFLRSACADETLFDAINQRMAENLSHIHNYTCLETITRAQHGPERLIVAVPGKAVPFRRIDTLRIEVAQINGMELFSRPGEHKFDISNLAELKEHGMIGNGLFSIFLRDPFDTNLSFSHLAGAEKIDGESVLRYDFRVPSPKGQWALRTDKGEALVGYHGSIWIKAKGYDALRLKVVADHIPRKLGMASLDFEVDYATISIDGSSVLLPQNALMTTVDFDGWSRRNVVAFTHCREYGVKSQLHFDEVSEALADTNLIDLPAGLAVPLRLETAVDSNTSHAGDPIRATVTADVKDDKKVVIPAGASVIGRIRKLEHHTESAPLFVAAELEFLEVDFNGKQARFLARMKKTDDLYGVARFTGKGTRLVVPAGTMTKWTTIRLNAVLGL